MSGFKLYRSRIILALAARAYRNSLKLASQASTELDYVDKAPNKKIKLNNQNAAKVQNKEISKFNEIVIENEQKNVNKSITKEINHNQSQNNITQQQNNITQQQNNITQQQNNINKQSEQQNKNQSNQQKKDNDKKQLIAQQQINKQQNQIKENQNLSKQQLKEQKYQKSCGLHNIGNTCYFNSALQCIINTPKFNDKFLNDEIKTELNPKHKQVAVQYWKLLQKMRIPVQSSENPVQLKQAISYATKKFGGHRQEDSQEFLRALLTCLHEDLNRVTGKPIYKELSADLNKQSLQEISNTWFNYFKLRDNSLVTDYFTGQLLSRVTCSVCKNQSLAFDNFQDLSLAFPNLQGNQLSLEQMLGYYFDEEQINQYTCAKCKQQRKCTRQLELWRLPDILVIHLKRFCYKGPMRKKINIEVKFGAKLDLTKFIKKSLDKSTQNCNYDLYGIVKHYGDLNFGHYFAECKHPFTNKWYSLNDSSTSEIRPKVSFESDNSAYLLFYSRV